MQATHQPESELSQYSGHPVELETFQGPLDLLLHLIKKDRIEIWEISISRITRQYLQYLTTLHSLNIEVAGEFLVMAATLMRIKSQNLLPRPSFLPEDPDEEPITREGLIERLIEYRKFREAARTMSGLEFAQARKHPRGGSAALEPGFAYPLREPKLIDLAEYMQDLLTRREPVAGHEVHLEEVRLEDQIDWIARALENGGVWEPLPDEDTWGVRFSGLLRRPGMRLEVVVTFLAVLEMAKLQRLHARQNRALAEIWLLPRLAASREVQAEAQADAQGEAQEEAQETDAPPAGSEESRAEPYTDVEQAETDGPGAIPAGGPDEY